MPSFKMFATKVNNLQATTGQKRLLPFEKFRIPF